MKTSWNLSKPYVNIDLGQPTDSLPRMEIDMVDYYLLRCPWQKALISKVFGCNIAYKLLIHHIL